MNLKEHKAALIEAVELTEEELKEAITEGKKRKYFKLKHASYWDSIAHVEKSLKTKTPGSAPVVDMIDVRPNQ